MHQDSDRSTSPPDGRRASGSAPGMRFGICQMISVGATTDETWFILPYNIGDNASSSGDTAQIGELSN